MFDIFLSCSFRAEDTQVNDAVRAICNGVGLKCVNVSTASPRVPSDEARLLISRTSGLIAVATKRDRLASGDYKMPDAVHDEISIAYGLGKPLLILAEDGVRLDGFISNYGTQIRFERQGISSPSSLEGLITSIYNFKSDISRRSDPFANNQNTETGYYSEFTANLIALETTATDHVWSNSLTKRLRFEKPFRSPIATGAWPSLPVHVDPNSPDAEWSVEATGIRRFEVQVTPRDVTAARVDLLCRLIPDPQPGDVVEFTRVCRSRYFAPVHKGDLILPSRPALTIEGVDYYSYVGFVPVEPTLRLHVQFRVPRSYGLTRDGIAIFVASHTVAIDYLTPVQLDRIESRIESFSGNLVVDIEAEYPLPRHMYGVAWVPPF